MTTCCLKEFLNSYVPQQLVRVNVAVLNNLLLRKTSVTSLDSYCGEYSELSKPLQKFLDPK